MFLCMHIGYVFTVLDRIIIMAVLPVLAVLPILLACILLNRFIFKSADMIGGAING